MSIYGSRGSKQTTNTNFTAPFCVPAGTSQFSTEAVPVLLTATTNAGATDRIGINNLAVGETLFESDYLLNWICGTEPGGKKEARRIVHVYPVSAEVQVESPFTINLAAGAFTIIGGQDLPGGISVANTGGVAGELLGAVFPIGMTQSSNPSNANAPWYGDASGTAFLVSVTEAKQPVL